MDSRHDQRHEDLLSELAAGDRSEQAFAQSALAACGECREIWRDFGNLERRLDSVARSAREAGAAQVSPESTAAGDRYLRERLATARVRAPIRPSRVLAFVAATLAAGILLYLGIAELRGRQRSHVPDTPLGGNEIRLLAPVGLVDAWGTFRWSGARPADGWFVVRVFDADAAEAEPRIVSDRIRGYEWTPAPDELGTLRNLRWELQVFDSTNSRLELRSQSASLRH
jgi:hypothetical protein